MKRADPEKEKDKKSAPKLQLPASTCFWPTYNLCRSHAASVGWPVGTTPFANLLLLVSVRQTG
jgi:hypothetical protein